MIINFLTNSPVHLRSKLLKIYFKLGYLDAFEMEEQAWVPSSTLY